MRTLNIATTEDALDISKGFSAVRAYDPDQVDGQCIQTPDCPEIRGYGQWHSMYCPLFQDNSHASGEDSYGNDIRERDYDYGY